MPIDYLLAFRACIWYMKIRLNLAGTALKNQLASFSDPVNDEIWASTCFYRPAHEFIKRLDPMLLDSTCIRDFRIGLRDAIYRELSLSWRDCTHAPICHVIHPDWTELRWSRLIFSRHTSSLYHQIAVGRGKFGDRRIYSKFKRSGRAKCRYGCDVIESAHHLFFECPGCYSDTLDLRTICRRNRIDYSLRNIFSHHCLKPRVEMLLGKIFPKEQRDFFSF